MKCPVCEKEMDGRKKKCDNCGFSNFKKEFLNQEDCDLWQKETVEPCRTIWRQKHASTEKNIAMRYIYHRVATGIYDSHPNITFARNTNHIYISDAYTFIRLRVEKGGLEIPKYEYSDGLSQKIENGTELFLQGIDNFGKELTLPSFERLYTKWLFERLHNKQDRDIYFDFGENKPFVRASFLVEFMEYFPNSQAKYSTNNGSTPFLCLKTDYGEGVILPSRRTTESEKIGVIFFDT